MPDLRQLWPLSGEDPALRVFGHLALALQNVTELGSDRLLALASFGLRDMDADLARLDRQRRPIDDATPDKARWQRELAYIARERGYRPGWASHKFKEKFGHWPTRKDVAPLMKV